MAITEEVVTKFLADVSDFNAKFTEMENRLKTQEAAFSSLQKTQQEGLKKTGNEASALSKKFEEVGRRIAAAFTVAAVIAFGKASVQAFAEAELSARKLNAALSANGGTQEQLKSLLNQSKELQRTTIFSDEQIQAAQTLALQFGLTATEVQKLIPVVADFASATGQDLKSALESVLRGSEGVARGLKVYGIEIDSSKSRTEKLAQITEQLTTKFSGQAVEVGGTTTGAFQKLKNTFDELQETMGGFLAKGGGVIDFLNDFTQGLNDLFKTTEQKDKDFLEFNVEDAKNEALKELDSLKASLRAAGKDESAAFKTLIDESNKFISQYQAQLFITFDAQKRKSISVLIEQEKARIKVLESAQADEKKIRERTVKEGAEEAAKNAEKLKEAQEKAAKEAADKVEKINDDNFKLAEDNLRKFQAEQLALIEGQNISREEKEKAFADLELQVLNARRQNYIDYGKDIGDIDVQIVSKQIEINKQREKSDKDYFDNAEKLRRQGLKDAIEKEDQRLKEEEEAAEKRKQLIRDVHDLSQSLLENISNIFDASDDRQLDRIEDSKDRRIQAIDEQIEALEEANDKGKLSDKKFEEQKKKLIQERAAAEKQALAEQNKIKRQEAERDKLLSLFRIGLILAEALAELNFFKAAIAGAELITVAATPLPEFWKGTKGKDKSGLGYVGERGKELMYIPGQTKIVPNQQTEKHKGLIDAMIDNNLEKYVYQNFVAPALVAASKKSEKIQSQSFAENIARSFKLQGGVDEYGVFRALEKNNKWAAKEIGKAIAKNINTSYKNPRYH